MSCHDEDGSSQLVLNADAAHDFRELPDSGYLFTEGTDTLLARIMTNNPKTRMPKGKHAVPWDDGEKAKLKNFLGALDKVVRITGRADELFPTLDRPMLLRLFTDGALREEFRIQPADELITYRSVNGNKARSKFSPHAKVQAMMTYELMRAGMTCASFIESRDIRRFDSHKNRGSLWGANRKTPVGQKDQTDMMREDLWDPLHALVARLKGTEYQGSGKSLFDHTNIVLTSEFGRSIHGSVDDILQKQMAEQQRQKAIDGQDISAHWKVTSAAFLGGKVKGNAQYGCVGEKTLLAIPLLPDGTMDPAFDPHTGAPIESCTPNPKASIPDHGDVYATALHLSDTDPKGKGRNERWPLTFIKRA
ncbi:MAG: hypothetical protein ABI318_17065 [Chthoniobacteraceae bacterium]